VTTDSLIVVLDQSGSMKDTFPTVREEARRFLKGRKSGFLRTYYIDFIKYDNDAESALGGLRSVDEAAVSEVNRFLDEPPKGRGTNVESALIKAAKEVKKHGKGKPTTLVVLTDGQDDSIPRINQNIGAMKARFGGVEVHVNTITPRLLAPGADPAPADVYEQNLATLSENLGGRFGPRDK
jgi:Mg-chelatase subunit ChlD